MPNNLGHDKIPEWTADIWSSIDKAVADEHKLTAIAAQFLTPPVPDGTMDGTVAADTVHVDEFGVLSVDESETRSILEIAVELTVRQSQVDKEEKMKTAEHLARAAANLIAKGEDLLIFQGLAALDDPLFKSKVLVLRQPKTKNPNSPVDSFLFPSNKQTIPVEPVEIEGNGHPIFGDNTFAAVAQGYALLQKHHYGRQALVLPPTIYADTYATRATTLEIPAITADRIKGLIGPMFYATSALPDFDFTSSLSGQVAKGVLVAIDGETTDLVVQMIPTVEVVTQDAKSSDHVCSVYERFALRLKDPLAVVELDFVPAKSP
jgi:hypothetical protein